MKQILLSAKVIVGVAFSLVITQSIPAFAGKVILIIGDGMDDAQITIARNYLVGPRGKLSLDHLPVRSSVQVLSVSDENPDQTVYVADSANSATAIATGVVTSRGRVGTTAGTDLDVINIIDLAQARGVKTGLVTTANVTDATPAAFYAHTNNRDCENPSLMVDVEVYSGVFVDCSADLKSNGGKGSISEQLVSSGVDVLLGGGLKHFTVPSEDAGDKVLTLAKQAGYQVALNPEQLDSIEQGKLLGLFSASTMPVIWRGEDDRKAEHSELSWTNLIHWSMGEVTYPEPMHCEANPEFTGLPTLVEMTDKALAVLSAEDSDFFLMIESASIDKQAHRRKACGSIGELQQLNDALDSALVFAQSHPDTLILVTADHGQAAQIIPEESLFAASPYPIYSPGHMARIITPEGPIMAINYATNDFVAGEHTGVTVPLLSNKVGVGIVPSMMTQPEIFGLIKGYLLPED